MNGITVRRMSDRFADARQRLGEIIGSDGIAVVPAAAEVIRSHDVHYEFHPDPDFLYLTGFNEPDAVAVIAPGHPDGDFALFVRPRNPEEEMWTGFRAGVDGAEERYGADAAYEIGQFDKILARYMTDREVLWYAPGNKGYDSRMTSILERGRALRDRSGSILPSAINDLAVVMGEMRLIKTDDEQEILRRVCQLSAEGHSEAMRFAAPGRFEYQVQEAVEYWWRQRGSRHNGYPSIVASGANACILHYVENTSEIRDGDLILIDAAAELEGYSSDITRTFPANGTFTEPQSALYEVVLTAEKKGIEMARPGSSLSNICDEAVRILTEGLVDLGLLPLSVEDSLAMHHYLRFFNHGVGHWLGLDVHDRGGRRIGGKPRPIEEGMTFTVEPGLYVPPANPEIELTLLEYDREEWSARRLRDGREAGEAAEAVEKEEAEKITHQVPAEFLGLGIRIEDDVLITKDGNVNLSASVAVEMGDIEALCAEKSRLPL